MRESAPTTRATSVTSADVASHSADTALMLLTRWARNAFATSLLSSLDHRLVVSMRLRGTHAAYKLAKGLDGSGVATADEHAVGL